MGSLITMYALVIDDAIAATAHRLPAGSRDLTTGVWITPPAGEWTPDLAASVGWLPITEHPRPDDTATHTSDRNEPTIVNGVPTITWTVREWTAEELAARQQAANADALTTDAAADLANIEQAISDTLTLLGSNEQVGSIRHHRTAVLTNQYQVAAQRDQDALILALAVVVRRLARQVARLTRLQAGVLDSADVGQDAT